MREAFAMQKLLSFFQQKNIGIFERLTFEILTSRELTTSLVLNNRALRGSLYTERSTVTGENLFSGEHILSFKN